MDERDVNVRPSPQQASTPSQGALKLLPFERVEAGNDRGTSTVVRVARVVGERLILLDWILGKADDDAIRPRGPGTMTGRAEFDDRMDRCWLWRQRVGFATVRLCQPDIRVQETDQLRVATLNGKHRPRTEQGELAGDLNAGASRKCPLRRQVL